MTGTSLWNLVWTGPTSVTVVGLADDTAHTFTVSTDVTPPTAPTNLVVRDQYCGEVGLRWTQSTDDQDPQAAIRYRIFLNGALDAPSGTPIGLERWITYGVDGSNTFVLRAVDSAGNVSAPSNAFTLELDDCM